jgi:hypothetical protein
MRSILSAEERYRHQSTAKAGASLEEPTVVLDLDYSVLHLAAEEMPGYG